MTQVYIPSVKSDQITNKVMTESVVSLSLHLQPCLVATSQRERRVGGWPLRPGRNGEFSEAFCQRFNLIHKVLRFSNHRNHE